MLVAHCHVITDGRWVEAAEYVREGGILWAEGL